MRKFLVSIILILPLSYSCSIYSTRPTRPVEPVVTDPVAIKGQQSGIASWYGNEEHGKQTASGEVFNKHDHTAAHKTLPLGSLVRVVNLENGRDVIVKINDRGPFIAGRIIDLSYASAKSIDIIETGTAKVKIEVISYPKSALGTFNPVFTVQVGSFKDRKKAYALKSDIGNKFDDAIRVITYKYNGSVFYRVRVGKYGKRRDAEKLAYDLKGVGYKGKVIQE